MTDRAENALPKIDQKVNLDLENLDLNLQKLRTLRLDGPVSVQAQLEPDKDMLSSFYKNHELRQQWLKIKLKDIAPNASVKDVDSKMWAAAHEAAKKSGIAIEDQWYDQLASYYYVHLINRYSALNKFKAT